MRCVEIEHVGIGDGHPAYIIAEASCNHNGSLSLGKELIQAAKECGANAIKFQNYLADDFVCKDNVMYEIFKKAEQKREFFEELFRFANRVGITMFSTAAAMAGADEIVAIGMPAIKLGSSNINNFPLLEHVAQKRVPILFSTGLASMDEIEEAVRFFESHGKHEMCLLHCVAEYPARIEDVNARFITVMKQCFPYPVGFSDHTEGIHAALASVSLGANMIEKHFTMDNTLAGPDHGFSATVPALKELVDAVRSVESALGSPERKITEYEQKARLTARRYLVAHEDIPRGSKFTKEMLVAKKPGKKLGLEPKYLAEVEGRIASRDIKEEEAITWDEVQGECHD